MVNSRRKGRTGEAAFRRLLLDRDYQVFPRPRGESGDDFTCIDKDGRVWSVEVKNTMTLSRGHYDQVSMNAKGQNRMLAWHPSGWGFPATGFVVFSWPRGGEVEVRLWK